MVEHEHYTYRVIWSEDDAEHVGLCAEFPSLSHLADTPLKAMKGIMSLVKDVVKDMTESGEIIPNPIGEKQYSGKFVVRILPEEHKMLAIQAAEMGVSLNKLASSKLTSSRI